MRKTRAAILPYPGDPFLLRYWLDLYHRTWAQEIDHLYIVLNSTLEKPMVEYIKTQVENYSYNKDITLYYIDHQIEHGAGIDYALERVNEELVMLVEDDCYIHKAGAVDRCFSYLESGAVDVVGSKRGSCSDEISEVSRLQYGLDYSGMGDQGCNFWPNLFFSSKQLLIDTDRNFAARRWVKGELIEPLNHIVQSDEVVGDTFVNTSIQVLAKIPQGRIKYIPQYHGYPHDLEDYMRSQNLWDGICPWVHVGSLSSGVGGALRDDQGRPLSRRTIDPPNPTPMETIAFADKKEWERRVQWWLTFYQTAQPTITEAEQDFYNQYGGAVTRLITAFDLSLQHIRSRQSAYSKLGL